jgi:hypothetical protein
MPAPLPAPRVPLGFPLRVASTPGAGGQTAPILRLTV